MSALTLRLDKGSPLTNTEVDTNFTNLNSDKLEKTLFDTCLGSPTTMEQVKTNLNIFDPLPIILALS